VIEFIVSGGQTGADRAALDVALALGIPYGGWCPAGRRAEDGVIPARYANLTETPGRNYRQRTEWNVRDSDYTLILVRGQTLGPGSRLTERLCQDFSKDYCVVYFDAAASDPDFVIELANSFDYLNVRQLNVAGSRESREPGIYVLAYHFLLQLLQHHNRLVPR